MRPAMTICDITDFQGIMVCIDMDTLNDLIQAALNRMYCDGYQDGQADATVNTD